LTFPALLPVRAKCCQEKTVLCEDISRGRIDCQTFACGSGQRCGADLLVLLQLFCPNLVGHRAGPRNEHSKARTPGPHPPCGYPAYIRWYVAGSALEASNAAGEVGWNGTSSVLPVAADLDMTGTVTYPASRRSDGRDDSARRVSVAISGSHRSSRGCASRTGGGIRADL
jgi:hypothetical protein